MLSTSTSTGWCIIIAIIYVLQVHSTERLLNFTVCARLYSVSQGGGTPSQDSGGWSFCMVINPAPLEFFELKLIVSTFGAGQGCSRHHSDHATCIRKLFNSFLRFSFRSGEVNISVRRSEHSRSCATLSAAMSSVTTHISVGE